MKTRYHGKVLVIFLAGLLCIPAPAAPILFFGKLSPSTVFPTDEVPKEDWFSDVKAVVADVNGTLIDDDNPADRTDLIPVIEEFTDLGIRFIPLTGMGYRKLSERLLRHFDGTGIDRSKIIIATQKGGIISNLGTNVKLAEHPFPAGIAPILYNCIRRHINNALDEVGRPDLSWYFQPTEGQKLRSLLALRFGAAEVTEGLLGRIIDILEQEMLSDPEMRDYLIGGKLPFSITVSGEFIEFSVIDKVEALDEIGRELAHFRGEGDVILIAGDTGDSRGNDAGMLRLKEVAGFPVRTLFAGGDRGWARGHGIDLIPVHSGPVGVIGSLKQIVYSIRERLRRELVRETSWTNVNPAVEIYLKRKLQETDFLDRSLKKFFGLSLNDVTMPEILYLGQGNENYVCGITFTPKPEACAKLQEAGYTEEIPVKFLIVVPHREIQTRSKGKEIDAVIQRIEMERIKLLSDRMGKASNRRFPILGVTEGGFYSREWLDGEEIGEVAGRITEIKELAKLLGENSRTIIDFWNRFANRRWFPMVHDDDVIVEKTKEGYKCYLPDLNTPLFNAPPLRMLNEIIYLSYELTQIFYQKKYERHALINYYDVRMILKAAFQGVMKALGEKEGIAFFQDVLASLSVADYKDVEPAQQSYFASAALRFYIERFLKEYTSDLPELLYGRAAKSEKLNWNNTTRIVDRLRRFITTEDASLIPSLSRPRPFDDHTRRVTGTGGGEADDKIERRHLVQFKANSKTFERIGEIIIGIKMAPLNEDLIGLFPENTYIHRLLKYLYDGGHRFFPYAYNSELLYCIHKDFPMLLQSIPSDWMKLYRLVNRAFYPSSPMKRRPRIALHVPVNDDPANQIGLQINRDLGKNALLWHPTGNIREVFSFDVYINEKFSGIIVFSIKGDTLILEQIRLSVRRKGVGTKIFKWVKAFAQENGLRYMQTFDFVHFITLHVAHKIFGECELFNEGQWQAISINEAKEKAIVMPTGWTYRFKIPEPDATRPIDVVPLSAAVAGSA